MPKSLVVLTIVKQTYKKCGGQYAHRILTFPARVIRRRLFVLLKFKVDNVHRNVKVSHYNYTAVTRYFPIVNNDQKARRADRCQLFLYGFIPLQTF